MEDLRVLSALIGLMGAARTGVKTADTDRVSLRALAFYGSSDESAQALTELLHRERNAVSPECATCLNPCGNTSDYDLTQLTRAMEDEPALIRLLERAGALAARLLARGEASLPDVLQAVPDCAAWDPSPERIGQLEQEMEALS